jgi:hypothetical protein
MFPTYFAIGEILLYLSDVTSILTAFFNGELSSDDREFDNKISDEEMKVAEKKLKQPS